MTKSNRGPVAFQTAISDMRSRLREDGPQVDYTALCAFVGDALPAGERPIVSQYISTWRSWYDAYWEICASADGDRSQYEHGQGSK